MTLNTATIFNYKNIAEARLEFSPKLNCLIGNNGQGKTNVLDAIYYLSMCRSFASTGDNSAVIRHGEPHMMLQGSYTRQDTPLEISVALQRGKRKVVRRDGKEYQRLSQHIGLLPVVMVSPMDWDLVRGSGEERRRFMDLIISQNDNEYLDALIRYNKAVEQRNAMIKKEMRDALLYETVETEMERQATLLHQRRSQWVKQFLPIFMHYYNAVAGDDETVRLDYKSHLNDGTMSDHLAATRERDLILGYTTRGVHRDDLELMLNDYPMRRTGSQGQCKTYTIALRLAQFDFLKANNPAVPILLLDDIFDKLDASRVERIVDVVSSNRFGQIFITDTNRTHLDEIVARHGGGHCLMHVEGGAVTIIKGGETV
ncbi:MAG: DNA replication and repair protein RecF [Muribaculaceae bacterium]|nr:DNA replication and repair protein RecF [Muribaculaceae bacterium]